MSAHCHKLALLLINNHLQKASATLEINYKVSMVPAGRANRSEATVLGATATVLIDHMWYSAGSRFRLGLVLNSSSHMTSANHMTSAVT